MSKRLDFSRWAVVGYKDDTGLGRMAEDACAVLAIKHQLVFRSKRLEPKPIGAGDTFLDPTDPAAKIGDALWELQGLLVLETPGWHPELLPMAKRMGIFVAVVVMWEWFRADDPLWRYCDLLVCPNKKAAEVVRSYGFQNFVVLPWALDLARLPHRPIFGPARLFLHNAGLMDHDDRKGTRETISAFKRVQNPEVRLIVRLQTEADLPALDDRIEVRIGNLPDPSALYQEGDTAVQPSKMEGIGFMILEPICCGIPTITQNIAPLNEYVGVKQTLVRPRFFRRRAFASQWSPHAHLRLPRINQLARRIEWCSRNDLGEISRRSRQWAEETYHRGTLREKWERTLAPLVQSPRTSSPASAQ